MWIVKLALRRPYTFVVASLLIVILGILTIFRMPTDIFPAIDIPVVSIVWTYTGESPEDMAERIVTYTERSMTTTVSNIEHMESQSMSGVSTIKVFFQPNANIASSVAQVTSICQTVLKALPPGITPPLIIQYNASSVPIIQIGVSSPILSEQVLNDYATNFIRVQLATVQGASIPGPYGGKPRQIMIDIDPKALYAKGLSASDVVSAISTQNLILPAGDMKIGARDYTVQLNNSPDVIEELNNLPIKQVNGATVYIRDVAQVRDGYAVQTNIVRENGRRSSLLSILKSGDASTLDVVNRVKAALPRIKATLPSALNLEFLFDQSIFVKASIEGVLKEGLIAACLTAAMILIFLGSWRSTVIVAVSIPLSILVSIIVMSSLGQTLNIMTLGGLSLAVGILVDDATVAIENMHSNLAQGKPIKRAILDGAEQIATPTLVATLCICIVFIPVVFLSGVSKYLFVPLAMAVVFSMLASYMLSRTLVPLMANFLLRDEAELYREHGTDEYEILVEHSEVEILRAQIESEHGHEFHHPDPNQTHSEGEHSDSSSNPTGTTGATVKKPFKKDFIWRLHEKFNHQFEKFRHSYRSLLIFALNHRNTIFVVFGAFWVSALVMLPFIGQDFFPKVDSGQFTLHVRALPGTRLEETEKVFGQVEDVIRKTIPSEEISQILDNIGLPTSGINLAYGNGSTISPADGDILVSLKEAGKTFLYVKQLRQKLKEQFPDCTFFFAPADIVTQILNFGLPAAIDIQISGPLKDEEANYQIAKEIEARVAAVPGAVDVHTQQVVDAPALRINVDRTLAQEAGLSQRDIANSLLTSLSSSGQVSANYWLDPKKGVSYLLAVQVPQDKLDSIATLQNTPINNGTTTSPQLLSNLATVKRGNTMEVVNHYNIQPVFDVYASTQDRDLGGVFGDVNRIVDEFKRKLPGGSRIVVRGQVQTMNSSFLGLGGGLVFAIVLVYLLMVVNFQTWLDPLVIMMALPSALSGIIWMLFISQTTLSVPSLMGGIMCIGVATANSILIVSFANDQRHEGEQAYGAALEAGYNRLRPVLMTALAMIIGMVPMSLGLGEGGEQNAPLGRAVIGGLSAATFTTLIFVPVVYSFLRREQPRNIELDDEETFDEQYARVAISPQKQR